MKAFPSVMPASGCDKNKPGQLVDSNPSTVEVSGPYTRPFVREGSGRKAGKGIKFTDGVRHPWETAPLWVVEVVLRNVPRWV